jgi:serine/threonine protein kinase
VIKKQGGPSYLFSNEAFDIWGLGLTILYLLTGARPWSFSPDVGQRHEHWLDYGEDALKFEDLPLSPEAYRWLRTALLFNPQGRTSLADFRAGFLTLPTLWRQAGPLSWRLRQCIMDNNYSAQCAHDKLNPRSHDQRILARIKLAMKMRAQNNRRRSRSTSSSEDDQDDQQVPAQIAWRVPMEIPSPQYFIHYAIPVEPIGIGLLSTGPVRKRRRVV